MNRDVLISSVSRSSRPITTKEVLITVILTTVNGAELCNRTENVNNNISEKP